MKILRVKGTNIYDIFLGYGWKNHARYFLVKDQYGKKLVHKSGLTLSKTVINLAIDKIIGKK